MPAAVLIVSSDPELIARLTTGLKPYASLLSIHTATSRRQALALLEGVEFQYVVSSLEIPRMSDGYLFLSQINKKILADKIVVLTKEDKGIAGKDLHFLGIRNIYPESDNQRILENLLQMLRPVPAPGKKEVSAQPTEDTRIIRSSLSHVMGPVSSLIFDRAVAQLANKTDMKELEKLIAAEIGDKEQILQFYGLMRQNR